MSQDLIEQHLKISTPTFFRYKNEVIKEILKLYRPKDNEIEYQYSMIRKSLVDCYRVNKQIKPKNGVNKLGLGSSKK